MAGASMMLFVALLCTGAGVLAFWLLIRFPEAGPSDMTKALLQVAVSVVLLQLVVPAIHVVRDSGLPAAQYVVSFGIVLPALTYVFLAAGWLIRAAAGRLQGRY
jgi:hypothetical protein